MFMVTILIMAVSETVLLVTVCKCVYHTFFSFSFSTCFFFFVALNVNKGISSGCNHNNGIPAVNQVR